MAFTEEEKERTLKLYDELGSIGKVIKKLGYPSHQNMYTWIKNRDTDKKRKKYDCTDSPEHRRHPKLETKLEILHRCFEVGEDIKSISEEYGYGRNSIYQWRRQYLSGGAAALMSKKKHLPRGKLEFEEQQKTDEEVANMASRIKDDSPYFDLFTNELSLIS